MGSAGVGNQPRCPDNCNCVHSIFCRCPASPPPPWLRTALRLTLLLVGLFTCQSIRTSSTLTAPELRLHVCGSVRTLDCCALPDANCECWPVELQLTPHPPVVAKSYSNPRAHKAEVHYQRGTLVKSRPCGKWFHSPTKSLPFLTQVQANSARALPFLPQAQTNTILILNSSYNPLYSCSLDVPKIFTCAKSRQTNALPPLLAILRRIL